MVSLNPSVISLFHFKQLTLINILLELLRVMAAIEHYYVNALVELCNDSLVTLHLILKSFKV